MLNKVTGHIKTVLTHKYYVLKECTKAGLFWQGLVHDLSKFSYTEFISSVRNYTGVCSPIDTEKRIHGYSLAWQNHKGRNKHHWQYWVDFSKGRVVFIRMPSKYVVEMICDWVGASKVYNKGCWTVDIFTSWLKRNIHNMYLEDATKQYLSCMLNEVEDTRNELSIFKYASVYRVNDFYLKYDKYVQSEVS